MTILGDMVTSTTSHKHKAFPGNKQEVGAPDVRGDRKEGPTVHQKLPAQKGSGADSQNF